MILTEITNPSLKKQSHIAVPFKYLLKQASLLTLYVLNLLYEASFQLYCGANQRNLPLLQLYAGASSTASCLECKLLGAVSLHPQ
jgi:hypothetical protein